MGDNFDINPKGVSRYALSVCVFGRNTLGSGMAAPITAATSMTTTPFKGKHSINSSAAMIGWRITAPINADVQAATQNAGAAPVSKANHSLS